MEGQSDEKVVRGVYPYCLVANEAEELTLHVTRGLRCQLYFMHKDIFPEELNLDADCWSTIWRCPGLRSGILNVVALVEWEEEGLVSSVTPIPVLPYDAAMEMREIFDKTLKEKIENALLSDESVAEARKSAFCQAIWHEHIRSFAVDLDFLLNDMEAEHEGDALDEEMETALLKVFRSLYEFLKTWNAQRTIEFLIQSCKERGVISFYSECPEATDDRSEQPALYRSAPKFFDSEEESDAEDNNAFIADLTSNGMEDESGSSMARLMAYGSFEEFAEAGAFRGRFDDVDEDQSTSTSDAVVLESPEIRPISVKVEKGTVNIDCYVTVCLVVCMFLCFTRGYERKEPYFIFAVCLMLVAQIYEKHRCHRR